MIDNSIRKLLLSALRAGNSEALTARLVEATPEEWLKILDLSRRHRVAPLLYRQLKESETADAPPEITQKLRADYLRNTARNMRLYQQMSGILQCFHSEHIPVIPLKGLYLAERVYGNIAVRPMGDVDILVKNEDLSRVDKILMKRGFKPKECNRVTCEEFHHFEYILSENRLMIEVHWNLLSPSTGICLDIGGIWERSHPCVIAGSPTLELSPEDLLLFLCLHASKHVFDGGLGMVCDITETLLSFEDKIDWRRLQKVAQQWRLTRCLYVGLRFASELFNAPVPDNFVDAIKPHDVEPAYHILMQEHLFADDKPSSQILTKAPNIACFWTKKGIPGKVGLLWQRMFPSRKVMASMYPAPPDSLRILLYYPVRLKYLLTQYGRTVWHLVHGDTHAVACVNRQSKVNELQKWLLSE